MNVDEEVANDKNKASARVATLTSPTMVPLFSSKKILCFPFLFLLFYTFF